VSLNWKGSIFVPISHDYKRQSPKSLSIRPVLNFLIAVYQELPSGLIKLSLSTNCGGRHRLQHTMKGGTLVVSGQRIYAYKNLKNGLVNRRNEEMHVMSNS
jgi:hypothetical protein